jgi:hypothetical protein
LKERLVADWLTKAGERGGVDVAFSQVLLARGSQILRFGHSATEAGKDIIVLAPDGRLEAYQIKSGPIDSRKFEDVLPQVTKLVEAAVTHPNIKPGEPHMPFLVTSGPFSEPVQLLVRSLNESWVARGLRPLTLIGGPQLHSELMQLSEDFWPSEPAETRDFLSLYLANGKGDLDRRSLAAFLRSILETGGATSKASAPRRIAAAGLFGSYLLEPFVLQRDHWSAFCGWIIVAALQAWTAEIHSVAREKWRVSFEISKAAARDALKELATETLQPEALRPKTFELDDYTRVRNTIATSAVAVWHLIEERAGRPLTSTADATALLARLDRDERLLYWGESAAPHFLAIIWFLERQGQTQSARTILSALMAALAHRNGKLSNDPLAGPERSADEVLTSLFDLALGKQQPARGQRAGGSWTLEALIALAARRQLRGELEHHWPAITHVDMLRFDPALPSDLLLWHGAKGKEASRLAGKPQRWSELVADAEHEEIEVLPKTLCEDSEFALMFALAYPHRTSAALIKTLDTAFSVRE